jgi:hypothetical protein
LNRDILNVIIVYISLLMMAQEGRNMKWQSDDTLDTRSV